jgi:hypothetical protein
MGSGRVTGRGCKVTQDTFNHRVHTEWQWPLFGVYSIMMERSAQPSEDGGVRPPPFTMSTITYKVRVYAPAERADTLSLFLLCPYMYSMASAVQSSARTFYSLALGFFKFMNKETVQKDDTYVLSKSRFVAVRLILVLLYVKGKKTIVVKMCQQQRVETTPLYFLPVLRMYHVCK